MDPDSPAHQYDHGSEPARLRPFLRWPGGKRWLVQLYPELIPTGFTRYIEPFLGSGAVYFHLRPSTALLSDTNPDLITAFIGIRDHPAEVYEHLVAHHNDHGKEHYYRTRATMPAGLPARAARIIYLNRTCFNGVYRVNRKGEFNVPIGDRDSVLLDTDDFAGLSALLRTAEIACGSFEEAIDRAGHGDLVYADPPYTVRHNNNGFIKYNEKLFSWDDQELLAKVLARAAERGAQILATNAAHESVRSLYENSGFILRDVSRFSPIAASRNDRKQYTEIVISYP
jgi:DNA adenine methylase